MERSAAPYVAGMDIGGTNTVFGIVSENGDVLCQDSVRTQTYGDIKDYVDTVVSRLESMIGTVGGKEKIRGMGICAPLGNYYTGNIENAANLPWKGIIPLASLFGKALGISVKLTNDADAAAMGEMIYGTARGMKDFIMLTLGTGVGSGVVANGQLIYGSDGFAGELGHVIVRRNGRPCGCGRRGCLETYCSATGVANTAREFLKEKSENSLLRAIAPESITSKDVFDAAKAGDELAKTVFDFTGNILGEAVADFIAFTSPEAVIFFGGLANAGELLFKPMRESVDKNVLYTYKGKTKLLVSSLKGADAALLGASALGWEA